MELDYSDIIWDLNPLTGQEYNSQTDFSAQKCHKTTLKLSPIDFLQFD